MLSRVVFLGKCLGTHWEQGGGTNWEHNDNLMGTHWEQQKSKDYSTLSICQPFIFNGDISPKKRDKNENSKKKKCIWRFSVARSEGGENKSKSH